MHECWHHETGICVGGTFPGRAIDMRQVTWHICIGNACQQKQQERNPPRYNLKEKQYLGNQGKPRNYQVRTCK